MALRKGKYIVHHIITLYKMLSSEITCFLGLSSSRLFVHFGRKVGAGMPLLQRQVGDVSSLLSEN